MYFKRIEMHGFKSFAEPATIEFDKGITCVVGPNGSGKSNISDAIRWVLGEQSPKTLRGGKMEDVIFAGTENRKSRGMAEVTLVIDNSTSILPIDYNEVAITRRMYRSGESEYAINNNICRMRDIRELLMDTGIGVDGYSLIGQGKIAEIINNKTESIREIFEETAGIVSYRSKKKEAERKLNSASDNLDRVNDIIFEIESRIGSLEKESDKAKKYLELKARYEELEVNIAVKNIESIKERLENYSEDRRNLEINLEKSGEKRAYLDQKMEETSKMRVKLEESARENRESLIALIDDINALERQDEVRNTRMEGLRTSIADAEKEMKDIDLRMTSEQKKLVKLEDESLRLHNILTEKMEVLGEKLDSHSDEKAAVSEIAKQISSSKEEAFEAGMEKARITEESLNLSRLGETLDNRRNALMNEGMQDSHNKERQAEEYRRNSDVAATAAEKLKSLRAKSEEIDDKRGKLTEKRRLLKEKLENTKLALGRTQSRCRTLEEMEHSYEGYNAGVKYIMNRSIEGIEGVAGELIDVPKGLELAIETALGGGMQNIICTTDIAAKRAIEELKSARAGRVTMLPIESIKPGKRNYDSEVEDMLGFVDYAIDSVGFDERHRKPIEYLLGGIVIFQNMDLAMKAARKLRRSLRIVTLDGEVINSSGAVTGGHYKNKRSNVLERKSAIANLQNDVDNYLSDIEKISNLIDDNKRQDDKLASSSEHIRSELAALNVQHAEARELTAMLKAKLESMDETIEKRKNSLSSIDEQRANVDLQIKQLNDKMISLNNLIKENEEKIKQLEEEFATRQSEITDGDEGITELKLEVERIKSEAEAKEQMLSLSNNTVSALRDSMMKKESGVTSMHREVEKLIEEAGGDSSGCMEKKKKKEDISQSLKQIDDEIAKSGEELSEYEGQRITLDKEFSAFIEQKNALEIKIAKSEAQIESLKEKLWEEFELSYAQALDMRKNEFVITRAIKENREVKSELRNMGDVNIGAIEEYDEVGKRYGFLTEQRSDIEKSMQELSEIIRDMEAVIRKRFNDSFDSIVENFKNTFVEFFGGGKADIKIEDETNPLESDLVISAQPPGKQLKNINLLSGGEKTMTAIALMFAVLKTKPTPCCILDEVEAALDDNNIDIFAGYLRKFKEIQFTLITHQKTTMEHADIMYGVTMPERGISKIYSLNLAKLNKE